MSAEDQNESNSEAESLLLSQVFDRIRQMRQEFEDILFLKHVADTLRDFRKRLLREKWD